MAKLLSSKHGAFSKETVNTLTDKLKKQGTDPTRLAWGMLALFASTTVDSIAESIGIRGSASLPNSLVAALGVIHWRWR
jgi:hypothetical protein